jgi:NTP pyrophosphatase (non-canonical NTP hydrolase)
LYILDSNKKYVRVSKKPSTRDSNIYLYEFTGKYSKEDILQYLPEHSTILEHYTDYRGVIYTNENNFAPENIMFIGRFACWQHSLKQQDVLKEAQFDYDFRNIFSRQGSFTSQLVDFNSLNNIDTKEKLTKDYILHLTAEVGEVLNELNYKQHKAKKKINIDKVKEELIDMQKYLLNIFLVWGVSPQEFIKLFNEKSYKVEQRYDMEKQNAK